MKHIVALLFTGITVFANSFNQGELLMEFREIRQMQRLEVVQSFQREMRLRRGIRKDDFIPGMERKEAPEKEILKKAKEHFEERFPPHPKMEVDPDRFEHIKDLMKERIEKFPPSKEFQSPQGNKGEERPLPPPPNGGSR